MESLKLEILDDHVVGQDQVFNHLVNVRRLDNGQTGTLLCSHCCRWPSNLKEQATWIEGCYTPNSEEHNPKLLLGYHPGTITSWSVKGRVLTVSAMGVVVAEADMIVVECQPPLSMKDEGFPIKKAAYFRRQWAIASNGRELVAAVQAYFRSLDVSTFEKRIAWKFITHPDFRIDRISWDFSNYQRPEYGLEVYYDCSVVVTNTKNGYAKAIALDKNPDLKPLFEKEFGVWTVTDQAYFKPESGFYPAVPLTASHIDGHINGRDTHYYDNRRKGIKKGDFNKDLWQISSSNGYTIRIVKETYLESGYAVAIDI